MMEAMGNLARLTTLLAAGLAGCLAAGCTSSPGTGTAAPDSSLAVPSITGDPLNMTKSAGRPCTLLRPDQLAQYHLRSPGSTQGTLCSWLATANILPGYAANVDLTSGGLAALYRKRATMPAFQPTRIADYPAVNTAANPAAQRHGQCTVEVAVAPDTLVDAAVLAPPADQIDYADPCPAVDQFAESIVANAEGAVP